MDTTNLIESRVIADPETISRFVSHLPDLGENELYFLSLSARNKYLSEDDRERYSLGRTEMFSRQIAMDRDGIALALNRMAGDLVCKRTRSGLEIPNRSLVVYMNIHAMSSLKAYSTFVEEMNRHQSETIHALLNGNTPNLSAFLRMQTRLMNHIQRAVGTKKYVDIDVDAPQMTANDIRDVISGELQHNAIGHLVIRSRGGYHIMVNTADLKDANFQLHRFVQEQNKLAEKEDGEVCFNSNAMVPMPGTYQAGHLVTLEVYSY